ncbi:UNVERIFIED_CONTAM: DUF5713 family protein [Comamonas sp. A-3]|uniref:DUF5713 family protein n=1 Tax=Comamonas TaxID=283 RepID=UPI000708B266|nr:DUF5713 family protein [Comamonas thiooxydans]
MSLGNAIMNNYAFLLEMYEDSYFPEELVRKGEDILRELCLQIEQQKPQDLEQLYRLAHAATERFNDLQQEFEEQGSEIETAARECIAADFEAVAKAYGFEDADVEELIAPREW